MEENTLDPEYIEELQQSLNSVNLKKCEEMINEMSGINYGSDNNAIVKQIKDAYEMFDYHKVKDLLAELSDRIK